MTHLILDDLDCEYNGVAIVKRGLFSFIIIFIFSCAGSSSPRGLFSSRDKGLHRCVGFSLVMTRVFIAAWAFL